MKPAVDPQESPDEIRDLALTALREVAQDNKAPAAARAAAARTLLEAIGAIGRLQDLGRLSDSRSSSEMTPREIGEEIARLSHKLPAVKMKKLKL